jgi:hypothetical protein
MGAENDWKGWPITAAGSSVANTRQLWNVGLLATFIARP